MKGIAACEDCDYYVTIYRFTGKQGFFSVPKKWCEECDLLVRLVKRTMRGLGIEEKTELTIKPWFVHFWEPLLRFGAWHAPILVVNGKVVSQGIVPDKETLVREFTQNVAKRTELYSSPHV